MANCGQLRREWQLLRSFTVRACSKCGDRFNRGTFTINASFGQVGISQNRFRGTASSTFPACLHVPFSGESFISSNDYFHLLQFQGTETLFCQGHCLLLAPPPSTSSRADSFYLFNCFQPRSPSQSPISFDDISEWWYFFTNQHEGSQFYSLSFIYLLFMQHLSFPNKQ